MSLELARMRFDAPVEFDPEELRFEGVSPESRDVVLRRYEFRTLEPRFAALPVVGGVAAGFAPTPTPAASSTVDPLEFAFEPVAAVPPTGRGWSGAAYAGNAGTPGDRTP